LIYSSKAVVRIIMAAETATIRIEEGRGVGADVEIGTTVGLGVEVGVEVGAYEDLKA
jgi:hypothetical protein